MGVNRTWLQVFPHEGARFQHRDCDHPKRLGGPVGNFSLIEVAELQFKYIMQLIDPVRSGSCKEVSASWDATRRFDAAHREEMVKPRFEDFELR